MENHAGRPEIGAGPGEGSGRSIRHSATINRDLLYYAVRQPSASGKITFCDSLSRSKPLAKSCGSFAELWLASSIILVIAGIIVVLVSMNFSRRTERLTAFSQRVAEGDFRTQSSDGTGDALDVLNDSLNQTAIRLDATIRT